MPLSQARPGAALSLPALLVSQRCGNTRVGGAQGGPFFTQHSKESCASDRGWNVRAMMLLPVVSTLVHKEGRFSPQTC